MLAPGHQALVRRGPRAERLGAQPRVGARRPRHGVELRRRRARAGPAGRDPFREARERARAAVDGAQPVRVRLRELGVEHGEPPGAHAGLVARPARARVRVLEGGEVEVHGGGDVGGREGGEGEGGHFSFLFPFWGVFFRGFDFGFFEEKGTFGKEIFVHARRAARVRWDCRDLNICLQVRIYTKSPTLSAAAGSRCVVLSRHRSGVVSAQRRAWQSASVSQCESRKGRQKVVIP
nr:hypothetical protein CFP56_30050 [Quercus suber]